MRLFKRYLFKTSKGESLGNLFDKAKKLYDNLGHRDKQVLFYFDEASWNKRSALDRIIDRYPPMKKFDYTYKNMSGGIQRAISNLDEHWYEENEPVKSKQVDIEILQKITHGTPRSIPILSSFIILDRVDWFNNKQINEPIYNNKCMTTFPYRYLSPCIIVHNDYCNGKRYFSIWAIIEITPTNQNDIPLEIDERINKKLKELGKIERSETIGVPDQDEINFLKRVSDKVDEINMYYRDNLLQLIKTLPLPHNIKTNNAYEGLKVLTEGGGKRVSPKRDIATIFKVNGYDFYKYNRSGGVFDYKIRKLSPKNNMIEITFSFFTDTRFFQCNLEFKGGIWTQGISLPTSATIYEQEDIKKYIENIAVITQFIEETYINEIENIYGSMPNWYKYE